MFRNPILGGNGEIVRDNMHSRGYVAGVSGWLISRDGDAEFNDVVVRGELDVRGTDGSYVRALAQGGHADVLLRPQDSPGLDWAPALLTADVDPGDVGSDVPSLTIRSPAAPGKIEPAAEVFMLGPGELDQNAIELRANAVKVRKGDSPTNTTFSVEGDLFVEETATVEGALDVFGPLSAGNIDGGIELISFSSRTSFVLNMNFSKSFTAPPVVTCNLASGSGTATRWAARAINVTTTTFQLFVFTMESGGAASAWSNIPVHWLAVGM